MPPSASTQRVAKAARSSGRRARVSQRNFTFPVAIAAIVILGALLVGFGRDRRISASEIQPRVSQDHWHAAFGLYICDGFRPGFTDRFGDARGIHTHVDESTKAGDGVVHIHPFVSLASGRRADLSDFFHEIKLTATNSKIVLPGGETFENGTACPDGRAGSVKLLRWTDVFEGSPETITSDIAGTRFSGDLMGFVLAFVPDGVDVPAPASKLIASAAPNATLVSRRMDMGLRCCLRLRIIFKPPQERGAASPPNQSSNGHRPDFAMLATVAAPIAG